MRFFKKKINGKLNPVEWLAAPVMTGTIEELSKEITHYLNTDQGKERPGP